MYPVSPLASSFVRSFASLYIRVFVFSQQIPSAATTAMSSSAMMVVYSHLHLININFSNVSASIRADTRVSARSWFSVHAPIGAQCECCFRLTTCVFSKAEIGDVFMTHPVDEN